MTQSLVAQANVVDSLRTELSGKEGKSRIEALSALAFALMYTAPDEAEELAGEAIEIADNIDFEEGKILSWMIQSVVYMNRSELPMAGEKLRMAAKLAEEVGDMDNLALAKLNQGALLMRQGKYAEALANHIEGVKAAIECRNSDLQATHLMNIGVVNLYLEDFDEAEKYLLEALTVAEEYNRLGRQGQIYGNLGIVEFRRHNYGLSIQNHEKGLKVFNELEIIAQSANSLLNIGLAHAKMGNVDKANDYYDQAVALNEQLNHELSIGRVMRYKGELFKDAQQYEKAIELLNQAMGVAQKYKNIKLVSEIYFLQYECFEKLGNSIKALAFHKSYVLTKDSLALMSNQKAISDLKAQYEFDRLTSENLVQRQSNEIKDLRLRQRNLLIAALIILILVLVVTFYWDRLQLRTKLKFGEKDQQLLIKESEIKDEKLATYESRLQEKELAELTKAISLKELIGILETGNVRGKDWAAFKIHFDATYPTFLAALEQRSAELSLSEHRLAALLKMRLNNKEISSILGISPDSVVKAKTRLKYKLKLTSIKALESYLSEL
ncbi:MAG: tetratricopeptide repeat protein [Roseivirga sp.]|nr:tetratricopeptide repeat protein [Roseivirga sp.]